MMEEIEIVNGYEFKTFDEKGLPAIKDALADALRNTGVRGTIILATEGFNASLCGTRSEVAAFIPLAEEILATKLSLKYSYADSRPLRKIDVKIKPEIVTLKQPVDITLGEGTHVSPAEWNELIRDPETLVLDTRNSYEFETGTFAGAVNPEIENSANCRIMSQNDFRRRITNVSRCSARAEFAAKNLPRLCSPADSKRFIN